MQATTEVRSKLVLGALSALAIVLSAPTADALVTTVSGQDYINQCEAEGVPVPTVVDTTGGNGWIKKGNLFPDKVSAGGFGPAEVYYWTHSDESVCIALPRTSVTDPTQWAVIGLICQGTRAGGANNTSKACFFDTNGPKAKSQGVYQVQGVGTLDFIGGTDLGDPCTSCHAGQNAFIIHPGWDPLQAGDPTGFGNYGSISDPPIPFLQPDTYFEPIHPNSMPANPPASPLGCGTCHGPTGAFGAFPDLSMATANICDILLWTVGEGDAASAMTMPAGQRPIPSTFYEDYNALREACGQLPLPEFNPSKQNMSFDFSDKWVPSAGSVSIDNVEFTEGIGALSVDSSGYVSLASVPFDSWFFEAVGSELKLDVYLSPADQPNPYWLGAVQLYVTIPATGQVNQFLGHVELTPVGTGWSTATFLVPSEIKSSLLSPQTGIRFGIAVNTPPGAPPVLLDNLRFEGDLEVGPPSPPRGVTQFEFEASMPWTGVSGAVDSSETSMAVGGYNTPSALQINLVAPDLDGMIYAEPAVSPAPGSTVKYRVYIPTGAPVTAIQPFFMDDQWVWTDSWNPSLPRDAWITLSVNVPSTFVAPLNQLGLKIYLSEPYDGPIYLDAIEY